MKINSNITCADFFKLQLGHKEKYTPVDGNEMLLKGDSGEIRYWIAAKVEDNLGLTADEACNIEDVGSEDGVFCRYIVTLPMIKQDVFIHFFFKRHGVEIAFLIWGEDDPCRDGDPVRIWEMNSDDDSTAFGMAKMHLRLLLGRRSHKEIMDLYK